MLVANVEAYLLVNTIQLPVSEAVKVKRIWERDIVIPVIPVIPVQRQGLSCRWP